jgi:DNA-binding MarR family transcriptional regulator
MGYVERQRDPADERQVRISVTKSGKRLREKSREMSLADATGLAPDEFVRLQKTIVKMRSNLIESVHAGE